MINLKKVVFGLSFLLALVVLFFSGYLIYISKVKSMLTLRDINVNEPYIKEVYQNIKINNNKEEFNFYNTQQMSNDYLLLMGLQNSGKTQISLTELKDFLSNKVSYKTLVPHSTSSYDYLSDLAIFKKNNNVDTPYNYGFLKKLVSAKENETTLILTEKSVYYMYSLEDDIYTLSVYKNLTQKELLYQINTSFAIDPYLNIEAYLEDAQEYEYIFEKEKDNYLFKELKKI